MSKSTKLPSNKIRKTTLQQINYTEELRIPTYPLFDLDNINQSLQLRYKPTNSRKQKSKSVRHPPSQEDYSLTHLIRKIKTMQIVHKQIAEKVKKIKLKPKAKQKKITQLTKPQSDFSINSRIRHLSMKKVQQDSILFDLQSQKSTRKQQRSITPNDSIMDIAEIHYFSNTKLVSKRKLSLFEVNIYETMAKRIQRAWRKYKTEKIIEFYSKKNHQIKNCKSNQSESTHKNNKIQQIIYTRRLRNIEEKTEQLKQKQFKKWNQIIELVQLQLKKPSNSVDFIANLKQKVTKNVSILKNDINDKELTLKECQKVIENINNPMLIDSKQKSNKKESNITKYQSYLDDNIEHNYSNIQSNKNDIFAKDQSLTMQKIIEINNQTEQIPEKREQQMCPTLHRNQKIINYSKHFEEYGAKPIISKTQIIISNLLTYLLFEFFNEISKYPKFIELFKLKKGKLRKQLQNKNNNKIGFKTNLNQIKLFVNSIIEMVLKDYPIVLKNLQIPRGPSGYQILKYMHKEYSQQSQYQSDQTLTIIPNQVFEAFLQNKVKQIVQSSEGKGVVNYQQIKYLSQIFYRSLFDCLNECLEMERNFGQFGKQFPWKKAPFFEHQFSKDEIQIKLEKVKAKILSIASTSCGIIVQKEDLNQMSESQFYLQQFKLNRLTMMLQQDLYEEDPRWLFYDDQQVQTLVQLSNQIENELYFEIASILSKNPVNSLLKCRVN